MKVMLGMVYWVTEFQNYLEKPGEFLLLNAEVFTHLNKSCKCISMVLLLLSKAGNIQPHELTVRTWGSLQLHFWGCALASSGQTVPAFCAVLLLGLSFPKPWVMWAQWELGFPVGGKDSNHLGKWLNVSISGLSHNMAEIIYPEYRR